MILGRRGLGTLLLAVATLMFSVILLSTTSSGAQARAVARAGGTMAVAGDGECVDVNTENSNTQQIQQNGNETSGDEQTLQEEGNVDQQTTVQGEDTGQQQTLQEVQTDGQLTLQGANTTNQQTRSNDVQLQNETGDLQQSQQSESGDVQLDQVDGDDQQNGDEDNVDEQNGDVTNGEDQALQDGGDGTQSTDANADDCVVADTVPDEVLPPTGAPAKPRADEATTEKKKSTSSGKHKKSQSRTGKHSKSASRSQRLELENRSEKQGKTSDGGGKLQRETRGQKLEIADRNGKESSQEKPEIRPKSGPAKEILSKSTRPDPAPRLATTEWAQPTNEEVASADQIRRFPEDPASQMTLSVRAMGLYNVPVKKSKSLDDLDNGLISMPGTSNPWDRGKQKNVYIAGHYLGRANTASRLIFYNLDKLQKNDEVVLKDDRGETYKYRVSDKFEVDANAAWVMGEVRGQDMVTLQTCVPPNFDKRLIVQAHRV